MEHEGSFPHSQHPATCSYPETRPISWRSILILFYHPCLALRSSLLPSGFRTKPMYASLPLTCYMSYTSHFSSFDHPNIWWGVQSIKLLVMYSSPLPCYLVPLRPKYPPQHPILKNPQSTFLLHCEWPSFSLQSAGVKYFAWKKCCLLFFTDYLKICSEIRRRNTNINASWYLCYTR